ncbi:MAG: hypothetical protein A4E37_00447 [Methanoregulaceae archaeon PtaB.Bin056]|nr:MAG: hypothetical protein A4E37_00447 [Methanoregulaceae archaeon PtaB.Bin056]
MYSLTVIAFFSPSVFFSELYVKGSVTVDARIPTSSRTSRCLRTKVSNFSTFWISSKK